jgi:uncharacterized protein (DUF2164 family)
MSIRLTKEQKDDMKERIQHFVYMEYGEEIGDLAADNALHFVIKELAPYIYNQGIADAKTMIEQKLMNLDEDLSSLERPFYRK